MIKGGVSPGFLVKGGYRPNTATGGARPCPRLPQILFWRASKVPADLAEHAPCVFFSSTLLGLTGPRRTRGLREPPFWPRVGETCPRKSTTFIYYPRVNVLSPHLTGIIPLHDHLRQPQKQAQTHLPVTVYNSSNKPRAEQPANNRQMRVVVIDFFGK